MANANPRAISRRRVVKSGLALAGAQIAAPFVISRAGRASHQDRPRQSAHRHLRGARQERADRLPAGGRADQRQGRHPRPPGRTAGRGFDQRRRRHRGAEGAQADRPRQGQLPARQRELGAGARDGAGRQREEASCTSCPAAIPMRSPARLPLERLPRLQHDADGGQCGRDAADRAIRQEVVLHHARLCLRPYAAGGLRGKACNAARRHEGRRRPDAARHDRLLLLPDQGAGGEPGRHHLPEAATT